MDNIQKEQLASYMEEIEKQIPMEEVYVGFNGHGHLKYIQATRSGLLKLGIFFIKSSFSQDKYIDICSEEKRLEWIDPESEEAMDYIEIIEDIDKTISSRKIRRRNSNKEKPWYSAIIGWGIYIIIFFIISLIIIGLATLISWL